MAVLGQSMVRSQVGAARDVMSFGSINMHMLCKQGIPQMPVQVCASLGQGFGESKWAISTKHCKMGEKCFARRLRTYYISNGLGSSMETESKSSREQTIVEPKKKKATSRRRKSEEVDVPNTRSQETDLASPVQVNMGGAGTNHSREAESKVESSNQDDDFEIEKGYKMSYVCSRFMEVLMYEKPKPEEWRTLLAFTDEWRKIRPHFFRLFKVREEAEQNLQTKSILQDIAKKLKEVDDEMERHNDLLSDLERDASHLDVIIAERREDFTSGFFDHIRVLCEANANNLMRKEELSELVAKCLAFVTQYDKVAKDEAAMAAAERKLAKVLSAESLDAACKVIDKFASEKQLDPTLMLVITKAWISAKNSTTTQKEIKSIMYRLYMTARGNIERMVPKEIHLLSYVLGIEDPQKRFVELTRAFSPGDELEGKNPDTTYTKPERLLKWIKVVLDAYYSNRTGTLIQEAQKLADPQIIGRLELLKKIVEKEFL